MLVGQDYTDTAKWHKVSALEGQDYLNPRLWKQQNVNGVPDDVLAFTSNSEIHSTGALHLSAAASRSIDAVVVSVAVGIALGVEISVGVAGAGVYAENRIVGNVKAYIDGGSGVTDHVLFTQRVKS